MTNINKLLALNLKQNRELMGLTQEKLAQKAGVTKSYLAAIESCSKYPSPHILEKLALALEIDTPELFLMPSTAKGMTSKLERDILADLEQKVAEKVNPALKAAVSELVADHLKIMDEREGAQQPSKKKSDKRASSAGRHLPKS